MTVAELIKQLQQFPEQLEVYLYDHNSGRHLSAIDITKMSYRVDAETYRDVAGDIVEISNG